MAQWLFEAYDSVEVVGRTGCAAQKGRAFDSLPLRSKPRASLSAACSSAKFSDPGRRHLPPAEPRWAARGSSLGFALPPGRPHQDQSQKPLRAEEASRAYGRRTAPALSSARANQGSARSRGAGSIHRSFRLARRAVFCSFLATGRPESAWSVGGSARAATEAEFSSVGLETGRFAAEFSIATDGAVTRPTATLAISGASVNARTRTRRGWKNEHPCSVPGGAPRQAALGCGLASAAKLGAEPPPPAEPALFMPFCASSTRAWEPSAALNPASDFASAVAAPALAGLGLVLSATIDAPTAPTVVPIRTETAITRMSRRKRVVRQKPPNSG